jgi:hypothetical protein
VACRVGRIVGSARRQSVEFGSGFESKFFCQVWVGYSNLNPNLNPTAGCQVDPTTRRGPTNLRDYDPTCPTSQQKRTARIILYRKPIFRNDIF